jgi:hypothetical protein
MQTAISPYLQLVELRDRHGELLLQDPLRAEG